jgi:hypothetical protein
LNPLLTVTLPSRIRVLAQIIRSLHPFPPIVYRSLWPLRPPMTWPRQNENFLPTDDETDGTTDDEINSLFNESDNGTDDTSDTGILTDENDGDTDGEA